MRMTDARFMCLFKRMTQTLLKSYLSVLTTNAWMALNFLNFDNKKTEVMVFGGPTGTPFVDLGFLAPVVKPTVTNLGFEVNSFLNSTTTSGQ